MKRSFRVTGERGQGLVEYVLLLVLVALVVMVALTLFGPAVGGMYRNITDDIFNQTPDPGAGAAQSGTEVGTAEPDSTAMPSAIPPTESPTALAATATSVAGSILTVSAQRTGGGNGNALNVTVTVSAATTLTLVDSQGSTRAEGVACNLSCTVHLANIGKDAGYIAVTSADGSLATAWYPAKSKGGS